MAFENQEAGKHWFDGEYMPETTRFRSETFSVGIFQWAQKRSGGLKRLPVIARVTGPTSNPDAVYEEARRCCAILDDGGKLGFKTKRVGFSR